MGPRVSGKVINRAVIKAVEQTTRSRALMGIFEKMDQIPVYNTGTVTFDWNVNFDTNPYQDAVDDILDVVDGLEERDAHRPA